MKKYLTKENTLGAFILGLSILGARLQSNAIDYTALSLMCFAMLLVSLDRLRPSVVLLFGMSLGILYQVTLMTPYLVGTDVQGEYYCGWLTQQLRGWDYTMPSYYNTSLSTAVVAPLISSTLHIDLYWVYKAIYPICLALVPVVLFYIFSQEFNKKIAFLSCFFFISIPTYIVELSSITKQQTAELLFSLAFALLILRVNLKPWKKYLALFLLVLLTGLFHYSLGVIIIGYLVGLLVVLFGMRYILKREVKTKLKLVVLVVLAVLVIYGAFFTVVAEGRVMRSVGYLTQYLTGFKVQLIEGNITWSPKNWAPVYGETITWWNITGGITGNETEIPLDISNTELAVFEASKATYSSFGESQIPLAKVALGLDFFKATTAGKGFRVVQILTEILVVIGSLAILWRWKRYSPEYVALVLVSLGLLVACIFFPGFSSILNPTRYYNIALIFLAPAAIVGGLFLLRKYILLGLLLVVYFLFTSGIIYEATKAPSIGTDLPYNYALSAERTGSTVLATQNDGILRDWVVDNVELRPIYADLGGKIFLENKIYFMYGVFYLPFCTSVTPDGAYIFLTEWNERHQSIVFWANIGTKVRVTYQEQGLDKVLEGRPIVKQIGEAKLYGPKMGGQYGQ